MKILTFVFLLTILFYNSNETNENIPEENTFVVTYKTQFKRFKSKPYRGTHSSKLFISGDKSVFLDEKLAQLAAIERESLPGIDKANKIQSVGYPEFTYIIKKDHRIQHSLFIQEHLRKEHIAYEEPLMNSNLWNILSDTSTVAGLLSYKAICTFGGRNWTAWFTPEIPISEGPYKFSGLPGLIIRLDSEDGDYNFTLSGVERLNDLTGIPPLPDHIIVSKMKFFELLKLSANPVLRMESNGGHLGGIKLNGKVLTREEWIHHLDKEIADKNHIENFND